MKALLVAYFAITAPAFGCGVFTSELWDSGVRIAELGAETLTISHEGRGSKQYNLVSGGTGVPYSVAINTADENDRETVRKIGDLLVISMEVFEPYCGE